MPVYDALYDYRDRLNHILVRHEQGAVHAAQGYARVSGRVGCTIVTSEHWCNKYSDGHRRCDDRLYTHSRDLRTSGDIRFRNRCFPRSGCGWHHKPHL